MTNHLGILAICQQVETELQDAGIRAWVDASKVTPPGVWIAPGNLSPDLLNGSGSAELELWLVAPDTSYMAALRALDSLLGDVLAVVQPNGDMTPQSVQLPDFRVNLPAYRVPILATYTPTIT
jgi:hypothetical protein